MNHWKTVGEIKSFESYEWTIEHFNTFMDLPTGTFITSPMMTTNHNNIKWRLAFFPMGRSEKWKDYLSIFIQFFSDIPTQTSISNVFLRLSVISGITGLKERESLFDDSAYKVLPESECHNSGLLLSTADGEKRILNVNDEILDVNGNLKMCCEIVFVDPRYFSSYQDLHSIQDDYKKILLDEKFSDFVLAVGDEEIRVHKVILAKRSPVFEAMFTNEMQEKNQNRVVITDVQYQVLKELLHFIYTDTVDDIRNINSDLLIAADKYCVTGLKSLCEKTFSNDLNDENALERLILADTYNCAFLKMQVIYFIVYHSREIIQKKEFVSLRSDLMHEIIRAFSARSYVSST